MLHVKPSVRFLKQCEGRRHYTIHGGKACSCCHEAEPVKGQRYCRPCHAQKQREYRARKKAQLQQLQTAVAAYQVTAKKLPEAHP